MDLGGYNTETIELIESVHAQKRRMSKDILRTLNRLDKIALKSGDNALRGFAQFHLADAYYALELDYNRFRKHLEKAIAVLQNADEPELLARSYNYVGIDANNNGSFDIAYHYFSNALQLLERIDNNYLKSIINDNIGQVYARLGQPKEAIKYVRLSNKLQLLAPKTDGYYHQNLIAGYFSEAVLSIELNQIKRAEQIGKKIDRIERECNGVLPTGVEIPVSFLRLQLALLSGEEASYEEASRNVMEQIRHAHRIYDYMTDIHDLCFFLIAHDRPEPVRTILDVVTKKVEASGVLQMMKYLSEIEIAYYEKKGDRDQVIKYLRQMASVGEQQKTEQNRIYTNSIELIGTLEAIREEAERVSAENDILQVQVKTDPLTGLPNRLMFNRMTEDSFERMWHENQSFGLEILDVDQFKEYNDTYGHQAGDVCLKRVAREIERLAGEENLQCARYGGDEFIVIYENRTDEEILRIAGKLEERIESLRIRHGGKKPGLYVTVSQGICNDKPYENEKVKSWDFLTEADNALYAIKKNRLQGPGGESIRLNRLPHSVSGKGKGGTTA